ncbi:STAS domain-containing protein [Streptomyces sp. NPDC058470]|uniref:STAS domain-containing protein n=1 Tax=Streptomyces sp. NPDC058470 TaxID=3346515 RepID=UPI0036575311
MSPPQLGIHRHDRKKQTLVTLTGELDLQSAYLVRELLQQCLRDGIRTIDVDLTPLVFCDCSGLNVFLHAWQDAELRASMRSRSWSGPMQPLPRANVPKQASAVTGNVRRVGGWGGWMGGDLGSDRWRCGG